MAYIFQKNLTFLKALLNFRFCLLQIYTDNSTLFAAFCSNIVAKLAADTLAEIQPYTAGSLVDSSVTARIALFEDTG